MEKDREIILNRRIKALTWLFIVGLVLAGVTAIPLRWELEVLAKLLGADANATGFLAHWIRQVETALNQTTAQYPFLFYGTDWLAFGHLVIAIAFIGALRDPVRNRWLFTFGMIACALIVPYALVFGGLRGIPIWWQLVDCSFGVVGFVPVWLCKKWAEELVLSNQLTEKAAGGIEGVANPNPSIHHSITPIPKREATRF